MRAKEYIQDTLKQIITAKGLSWPEKVSLEPPKEKKFGDLATNIALVTCAHAKQVKQNPRQWAESLKEELLNLCPDLEKIEVAGPGFLNFFFKTSFWHEVVKNVFKQKDDYGSSNSGQGKKVQVEYVSANPTGPLHIGHGRGAAVGDSLTRILRFTGFDVHTEYYLNDAGRQMRLLGQSVWIRYQQLCGCSVSLPEDCYKGEYIKDIAKAILASHNRKLLSLPEQDAITLCQEKAMTSILEGIKKDLENFRVEHQVWFSEKSLVEQGEVEKTLTYLKDKGLAYEQDGALWFKSTQFGDDKDRVLKKSDGFLTYFASDIAYHKNKFERGFDLVIDIWGADHHGYVPRMKAAVQALGKDKESLQVILVQLVNLLREGEPVAMSTRAGEFVTLAEVCEEVGVDAARFIFLTRKSDSHLDFDLEVVKKKSLDNPVYYVQYAHARICSLMQKAREKNINIDQDLDELLPLLNTEEDMAILKHLDQFSDILNTCARTLSPHHLSYYLQELAGLLHRYYTVHPVLNAESHLLIQARMVLFQAVAQVLKNGLTLLGVNAPQRM